MIANTLKFCSWNIQGYNSRLVGNKFEDKEFLKQFEDIDFIGITETHMHVEVLDKMNIPGFHRLHVKNQPKNKKSNKASKGIAVFVKENIKSLFSLVMMDNEDAIWVKMKREVSGETRDVFIGTCYLNPSKSKKTDQKISKLADDVITLQDKGEVIIQGDFNARTGNSDDTISPDKSDELFDITLNTPPPKRNSQDIAVDPRGHDLLDMCKSLDLNIVNGRKSGDIFGEYTCIKYNGNSVVDYLITSPTTYERVSSFKVGEFLPWLSDHCPVYYTLEVHNNVGNMNSAQKCTKTKAPKQYIWSEESKQNFCTLIGTPEFNSKWDKSIEIDHSDPNLLVNYVTEVLISAADKAKIKYCKRNNKDDPPWFDKSCQVLKDSIKNLGTKIRNNPKDNSHKSSLFAKKKELVLDQVSIDANKSKIMWQLLKKFGSKKF